MLYNKSNLFVFGQTLI